MRKYIRGFVPIILLVGILVFAGAVFFLFKNDAPLSFIKLVSSPSPEPTIKTAYPWENKQLDKLTYKIFENKESEYATRYHKSTLELFGGSFETIQCLSPSPVRAYLSEDRYAEQISDNMVVSFIDQLKQYKFPSYDNPAQKFTRNINFLNICKQNSRYIFFFSSNGQGAYGGHGGYGPVGLAYTDSTGRLVIGPDYYDCLGLIGVTTNYAYLSCGWGDGPGGWGSIDKVSFSNETKQTIVKCETNMTQSNDNVERCYDSNQKLYYSSSK